MDNFVIHKKIKPLSSNNVINVYTDGSCINNGKPYACAGIGVYFGPNDPRNVSTTFTGKQTNNVAELLAIITALNILKEQIENGQKVNIFTDSTYALRCCTEYGEKCAKKNWLDAKKRPIKNVELVKTAYEFCRKYPYVTFTHIDAHTGRTDIHSIGNAHADDLAQLAATKK
jgi:ribonuclease HI